MAGLGGNMMAGVLTEGLAESGYGVSLAGFHSATLNFGAKLSELQKQIENPSLIAQTENDGYLTLLVLKNEDASCPYAMQTASYRREPHKFFSDLSSFLKSLRVRYVKAMSLSGSYGSLQLTVLYAAALGTARDDA